MKAVFSDRAYLAILAETYDRISTETGGIFLGCFENDTYYIIEAIDPGPKSVFRIDYFEYDTQYTQHLINKTARLYSHRLTLAGLWHRHPGSFDSFSPTDDGTNRQYAELTDFGAISVLVNIDPAFRLTAYHVSAPLKYRQIPYKVGDLLIPEHILAHKDTDELKKHIKEYPRRNLGLRGLIDSIKPRFEHASTADKLELDIGGLGDANAYEFLIDSVVDDISYLSEERGVPLNLRQDRNENKITITQKDSEYKITFLYISSLNRILFTYDGTVYVYSPGLFSHLLENSSDATDTDTNRSSVKRNVIQFFNSNSTDK